MNGPAKPFSFPTRRTSGPPSLNMQGHRLKLANDAPGVLPIIVCAVVDASRLAGAPKYPSPPFAPSNQTSKMGP
jgi:hypothetical protein